MFLPDTGVLIAGDMLSDLEIPLLDPDSADPFGGYRQGLELLAGVPGRAAWWCPATATSATSAEFRRRVAADRGYLDATEAGARHRRPEADAGLAPGRARPAPRTRPHAASAAA